jgi:hypothetical protein
VLPLERPRITSDNTSGSCANSRTASPRQELSDRICLVNSERNPFPQAGPLGRLLIAYFRHKRSKPAGARASLGVHTPVNPARLPRRLSSRFDGFVSWMNVSHCLALLLLLTLSRRTHPEGRVAGNRVAREDCFGGSDATSGLIIRCYSALSSCPHFVGYGLRTATGRSAGANDNTPN